VTDKSSTAPGPPDLELVLASILGGVIVLSADDRITFLNPAAEAVLQRSAAVLIGKGATELYPLLPWIEPLVARLKTEPATTVRGEGSIAEGHGEAVAVVAPLRDRVGQPDGTVVVLHDLGARQLLYDDDLARARLEELDGVVSRIAHELNNPLAGIRGAAQILEGKLSDRPEIGKYSSMIVRQVDRLSQLIHGLLMLETPAPAMEPLNIHRVLNDVILLAQTEARGRNVEIATAFDPSLPEVRGNQDQLQQLFLNLLKNAVAACPESRAA
jgi:two-component system nitrogen regulation sensor histidine kinase GlnL